MGKSTPPKRRRKATSLKPYPSFPLTAHPRGYWCKKVRGKLHYFGPIIDATGQRTPEEMATAALTKWEGERDYLTSGRKPPANLDGVTVADLCNAFLVFKRQRVENGELTIGMWAEYKRATDAVVATFGTGRLASDLDANDFARLRTCLSKGRKLVALGGAIRKAKVCFKWGYESGLLDRPPRYGQSFQQPSKASLRKERAGKGRKDYTADDLRALLDTAEVKGKAAAHLRAFVLLGINCGLGVSDIAHASARAFDLDRGWLEYPRAKTGVGRRCRLWPETVQALRVALAVRPKAKDEASADLAFLTPLGWPYLRFRGETCSVNGIAEPFRKLCKAAGVENRGFYSLRRTLATVGDAARDPVALRHVMGHAAPSSDMGDVYRQNIDDERLIAVAEHVRAWLWPPEEKAKGAKPAKGKNTKSSKSSKGTKATADKSSRPLRIVG